MLSIAIRQGIYGDNASEVKNSARFVIQNNDTYSAVLLTGLRPYPETCGTMKAKTSEGATDATYPPLGSQ